MLAYELPASEERLLLHSDVVKNLRRNRQLGPRSREAGGQLFAVFSEAGIEIRSATGLRTGDKRGRFSFLPSRLQEQQEISRLFN